MRFWLALGATLALSSLLSATPVCATASFASYGQLTTGCTIGDKLFSNFVISDLPAEVPGSQITVTPILGPDIGLEISGPFTVSGSKGLFQDSALRFDVFTLSGLPTIVGLGLVMQGSTSGLGVINLDDNTFSGGTLYHMNTHITPALGSQFSDSLVIPPTKALRVFKDVFVASGRSGSATVTSFEETFHQSSVPEPASLFLAGAPLLYLSCRLRSKALRSR